MFRGLGHVEHVIDDLEGQPDVHAEVAQALDLRSVTPSVYSAGDHAGGEQGAGLGAVNVLQRFRVGVLVFGFEVHHLAADHAVNGAGAHARFQR